MPSEPAKLGDLALVCPATKQPLRIMLRSDAEAKMNGTLRARPAVANARGVLSEPLGVTDEVLVRSDLKRAYPIADGIPVLLLPEALFPTDDFPNVDLKDAKYAEAYEEMEFYNTTASDKFEAIQQGGIEAILPTEMAGTAADRESFPDPWQIWVDAKHDSAAQWEAYKHLGSLKGKRIVQLGGSGTHAIKFAMAGAAEAWLVTPMVSEARFAKLLAGSGGFGDRFKSVVGLAEELPLAGGSFDGIFSGGCIHHTVTELAFAEIARALRSGGKFAAVEPWRAPLYGVGTKVLGKREDAYCRPLTPGRLRGLNESFGSVSQVQHGALSRYPFLALEKLGLSVPKSIPWSVGKVDDAVSSMIPGLRGWGSSIAVLATK